MTAVEVVTRPDLLTAAPTNDVVALQAQFQDLCIDLLDDGDYQRIGTRRFKTKSAWCKLAAAFNVSDDLLEKNYVYKDDWANPSGRIRRQGDGAQRPVRHRRRDRARYTNGRFPIPNTTYRETAHTRAKNRAFSDLFGLGEVSAEEMRNEAGAHTTDGPSSATLQAPARVLIEERSRVLTARS